MHSLEDPHTKGPLTTTIGRFVDRASYLDLFAGSVMVVAISTAYFAIAPCHHALGKEDRSVLEAAYFSVVTFTSLGYGDLSPKGYGRVVASVVVLSGLALIALLVGKIASERQHSILLLLHTSDCQRRINEFTRELVDLAGELTLAVKSKSTTRTQAAARSLSDRIEVVGNYLVFNANQARLVEFGNESSLLALYNQLQKIQQLSLRIHKAESDDLLISRRTRSIAARCLGLIRLMMKFHSRAERNTSYLGSVVKLLPISWLRPSNTRASSLQVRVAKINSVMQLEARNLDLWSRTSRTPIVLEEAWRRVPSGEPSSWPHGIHKKIAEQLSISNRLAQSCIDDLLKSGRLPKAA